MAAFLRWVGTQAQADKIDLVLFVSAGESLPTRAATALNLSGFPRVGTLQVSRSILLLAATNYRNFDEQMEALTSGFVGLRLHDFLQRLDVPPPAGHVLEDLGFGEKIILTAAQAQPLRRFLLAYRWEILKSAARARRGLFLQLQQLRVAPGTRLAVVDMGFDSKIPSALSTALEGMFDVDLCFYNLFSPVGASPKHEVVPVRAMLGQSTGPEMAANRALVEMLINPAGGELVGYEDRGAGMAAVLFSPPAPNRQQVAHLIDGAEAFCRQAQGRAGGADPVAAFQPFMDFVKNTNDPVRQAIAAVLASDAAPEAPHVRRRVVPLS
ncbi:hypothetical protein ABLE91_07270 [Aquabacter sp. CN5-332]|uniref:hypothetical protein n=1 Tax=Aquabacter sp. CN5-332 TaxID=3156608 RepID=UPI0032B5147A